MAYVELSTIAIEHSGGQYQYAWTGTSPYIAIAPERIRASNAVMYWATDDILQCGPYTLVRQKEPLVDGRLLFVNAEMIPPETPDDTIARQAALTFAVDLSSGAALQVVK